MSPVEKAWESRRQPAPARLDRDSYVGLAVLGLALICAILGL